MNDQPKLLMFVAHPDDAEVLGGGIASRYRRLERPVTIVSVTDGSAGHHERSPKELIDMRRREGERSADLIGASFTAWDFSDGRLQPTLEVRERIIAEIRGVQPDLVLTHRTCDYHPDHRAVGQAVQDASYMVTVPHIVPNVRAIRRDPVVAYLPDLFTRPIALRPDVMIDISEEMDTIVEMLACHQSQFFEWLPYHADQLDSIPDNSAGKKQWLLDWYSRRVRRRADRIRDELESQFGKSVAQEIEMIEMFEISEYARQPTHDQIRSLFPGAMT